MHSTSSRKAPRKIGCEPTPLQDVPRYTEERDEVQKTINIELYKLDRCHYLLSLSFVIVIIVFIIVIIVVIACAVKVDFRDALLKEQKRQIQAHLRGPFSVHDINFHGGAIQFPPTMLIHHLFY